MLLRSVFAAAVGLALVASSASAADPPTFTRDIAPDFPGQM